MKRMIATSVASAAFCLGGLVVAQASASTVATPVVTSFSITPKTVPEGGGSITLTVRVRNATTCVFGGVGQVMKSCAKGTASVSEKVAANLTSTAKRVSLWVYANGHGRRSSRKTAALTEAAIATACTGACQFTFPAPDLYGVASVTLNSVSEGVTWPDPADVEYGITDLPAGDQLDALSATMCAGSTGDTDVSVEVDDFALVLSSGGQASLDSVTFDSTVPSAFGNYEVVGPGQCVTGNLYFDAPTGSTWTSVNFGYESATNQLVYVWDAP
jgi:hypothetical protein